MPHPTWDETSPAGTAMANTLDTIIQGLKAEIRERMDDIVVDWTADPVVLQPSLPGADPSLRTGLRVMMSPFDIFTEGLGTVTGTDPLYVGIVGDAYIPLQLQKGWKMNEIGLLMDPRGLTVNFYTYRSSWSFTPGDTQIGTTNVTGYSGMIILYPFTGTEVVSDQAVYRVHIDGPGAGQWRYYGTRIMYDEV